MLRSKWTWIGLTVFLLLIIGVFTVQWAVNHYLSPEGVARELGNALDREAEVDTTHFSLWSGIRVEGVKVSEYPGFDNGTLLEAQSLSLQPEWWPLLSGSVVLNYATIEQPRLNVRRNRDGEWNLLKGLNFGAGDSSGSSNDVNGGASPIQLEIQQITLSQGTIDFTDETMDLSETIPFQSLRIQDFSLAEGANLALSKLEGLGATLSLAGEVSLSPLQVNLDNSTLTSSDLSRLEPLLSSFEEPRPTLGGSMELQIDRGTIRPDTFTLSTDMSLREVRADMGDGTELGWQQLHLNGELSGNPVQLQFRYDGTEGNIDQGFIVTEQRTEIIGDIRTLQAVYDGQKETNSWSSRLETGDLQVVDPRISDDLTVRSVLEVEPDTLRIPSFSGMWSQATFSGQAEVPLPYEVDNPISATLSTNEIGFEQVLPFAPKGMIPENTDISGKFSVRDLDVRGKLFDPVLEGTIALRDVSTVPPGLSKSITLSQGSVLLSGNSAQIDGWRPVFEGNTFTVDGSIQYRPKLDGSLQLQAPQLPLQTVVSALDPRPEIPAGWNPEGTVGGNATLVIKPDDFSLSGHLNLPAVRVGKIRGTNGQARFYYASEQLQLSKLSMDLYGGKLQGSGTVSEVFDQPKFRMSNQLRNVQLDQILTNVAGVGMGSQGDLSLETDLRGGLDNLTALSGNLETVGDSIGLKNVPVADRLDDAIVSGVSSALGRDLGPLLRGFLGRAVGNYQQELERVFGGDVTSHIDRLRGAVEFEDGKGSLKTAFLENQFLRFNVDGNLWLDGRLDTQFSMKEKQPLISRARQDWLRDVLRAGLPPFRVRGSVMNPQFDMNSFQKGVLKTLTNMAVSGSSGGGGEKSTKEKLKDSLLKKLFN